MEDENSSLALCRPNMAAQSQSFDGAVREVGIPSIDPREPIHEVDDSQLAGVSVVIAEDFVEGGGVAAPTVDVEVKTEVNLTERAGEKRKRGRPPRGQVKAPPMKKVKEEEEEDVCFICFDGGSLVLCDRRGCPKAYHPACIKRDEEFFRSKARWNCGWHICSKCQKSAHYMCYTCTYSLCKGCTKDADYVCVRGDKGFCTTCMRTVMLIENNEQGNKELAQVDFDDKSSWEYLFKVYWFYLKGKLSLTLDDLAQAKNPWKGDETTVFKGRSPAPHYIDNDDKNPRCFTHLEANGSKRRKTNEQLVIQNDSPIMEKPASDKNTSLIGSKEWATKDLLEFVSHMKNGDMSVLSQFDVQALLLDYIKINNLRDPRRKSQILCDFRLANLFGKPCVGHFEMLKLLEFHFLIQEKGKKDVFVPAGVVGTVPSQVEADGNNDINLLTTGKDKKRKTRSKKGEERAMVQNNLDEYAAIDVYNINLIYLRRSLMESLTDDSEKFNDKVVGSIVRIRICCNDQKQDLYRLVQVVGTTKVAVPYKIGNRTANVMLEVLNLDKKESISIDAISNQDFSEEECKRLRQSIRCGLVKRLTVGEIQVKAMALQAVRLNDWLEAEILRLSHLRDRASEKGRKKDLRECVEKIQVLKTPEERKRRLHEIPEVHSDPKMDPNYESEENAGECNDKKQDEYMRPRYSGFSGKGNKSISPTKRDKVDGPPKVVEKVREARDSCVSASSNTRANGFDSTASLAGFRNHQSVAGPTSFAAILSETSVTPLSTVNSKTDKLWHYRDPNGKIQGPFSMVQLQKWSTTGYFPLDMRIWATNRQDDPLLLTDALKAQFQKENGPASVSKLCNSAQNLRTLPVNLSSDYVDSSSSLASVNKSMDSPEQNGEVDIPIMYSPTPTPNNGTQAAETKQSEFVDLPSPTPKTNSEEHAVHEAAEEKQSLPSDCPVQDSNPSWGSASSLVVDGAQIPEIGDEWGGYSPTPPNDDHAATNSSSDIDQIAPPAPNVGTWDSLIEFSTLPEESVSDLLAEVDAMESRGDFVNRDDCFSSIEEFSPTRDLGKSDAFSSTCGNTDMGWSGNGNVNHGAAFGGTVGSESPQRSGGGGNFTTSLQAGNFGVSKANNIKPLWGRQSFGSGGGGGCSRPLPPPKGQRVCKFYESGHCKKGALCDYLHP